jgi:hypothetical protein
VAGGVVAGGVVAGGVVAGGVVAGGVVVGTAPPKQAGATAEFEPVYTQASATKPCWLEYEVSSQVVSVPHGPLTALAWAVQMMGMTVP